jgi:hypothetical protein
MLASAETEDDSMPRRKKHSPGEITVKLRQVEVMIALGEENRLLI